jgi:predicted ferric reductase
MKRKGLYIILISVILTLCIWIGSKWYYADWFADPYKYVAKYASLTATILFSWSMVLSARLRVIERWFGGLDKVYTAHKWLGIMGFWLVFLHPLFLGLHKLPDLLGFITYYAWRSEDTSINIGFNIGIVTLLLLISLILMIRNTKIPYHIWKKSHEFMTLFYLGLMLHALLMTADIAKYPLLGAWMYGWFALALGCGVYIRFLYYQFGPKYRYQISDIETFGDLVEINLRPTSKKMLFKPGQFVFVRFTNPAFKYEYHPYSIACAPNQDGYVKIGIKTLGDDTAHIHELKMDEKVILFGPYGNFGEKFLQARKDVVCVGGGIGITPFLGIWDTALNSDERIKVDECYELVDFDEASAMAWKSPRVHLFYTVKTEAEAIFDDNIQRIGIKSKFNGFGDYTTRGHSYTLHDFEEKGFIDANMIEKTTGNLMDKWFMLCGPKSMTSSLIAQLKAKGVKNSQIICEDYDMREVDISWVYRILRIKK